MNSVISVQTKDDKIIKIPVEGAYNSEVLKSILGWDEINLDDITEEDIPLTEIPCTEVDSETFNLINQYWEWKFKNKEITNDNSKIWFKSFFNFDDEKLFALIMASNYLQLNELLDESCRKVAEEIKSCKTPQEIRRRFNITNDFTPEEEEHIKNENTWCDD